MSKQQTSNYLKSLLDSLHHLFLRVSGKLRQVHLLRSEIGEAKGNADIWGRLGTHIRETPVSDEPEQLVSATSRKHHVTTPEYHKVELEKGRTLSELGKYYQRKVRVEMHPHMSDQMRDSTMEHINTSLHLAKHGDQDGAKLHIELAESAMHTASRFMTHDQYADFEKKVRERLESIIRNGHHAEPGN